ncbi:rRNA maturation RNase YbeY [Rubellicoccus peritrichatus]|uniref:Endoribonuclease YbeY n=1 Tax=Rubellicoccus peritrichatus TaxID=3080537 RepID=A0AAQ3L9F1_9BACT|nr:rRNA maturation RNase YbeY [Puniceicoccus sp. CR14]WOO40359.1 rRNA maturation RNase YbeY [Puniceicoccus sp. CR14]
MERIVQLNKELFKRISFDEKAVFALFRWLDERSGFTAPAGELSIAFLSDKDLAQVHGDFLDDPSPTDVITFPGDPNEGLAGEILVSVERAEQEAERHDNTFSEELSLYLAHGWLHLAGLDDLDPISREAMRAAEKHVMSGLKSDGRLPVFSLSPSN